ncbi:type IV secretory system conjugative DNA transfer family protein [Prescottella equi]
MTPHLPLEKLPLPRNRSHASGQIAVGIGHYGHPVVCDLDVLKLPQVVLGSPRTGKTRLANSMNAQQVRVTGGGACIIDFKGGNDVSSYWAEIARQENRAFHHFALNEKSSGAYKRPHPYARSQPSFYDPLVRGNGDSKTSMLLNSVDRDGDAAAYLRTAEDIVMLAFDIADLTGFSTGKGGLETLSAILNPATLEKQANHLTVDAVLRAHPSMDVVDARRRVNDLQQRVSVMGQKTKGAGNLLAGAIGDSQTLISKFANSSALGGRLRPGRDATDTIDLVRAVLQGEIVVFSLPSNDYRSLSILVSTMVLLDLQNATSTLRKNMADVRRITGDTSRKADSTPWKPFIVQVEELGSAKSTAAADALLGLLNKSSNEGIRVILSSQGWGDFVAVDGTGVWANQVLEQVHQFFCFQLGSDADDQAVCGFSGQVDKRKPRMKHEIDIGGRWRLWSGARSMNSGMTDAVRETRIPLGTLQELERHDATDTREFIWISKLPSLTAVHTVDEGPNMWFEKLRLVTVLEPPYQYDFFGDPADVELAEKQRDEVLDRTWDRVRTDPVLAHVLSSEAAATTPENAPTQEDAGVVPAVASADDPWAAPSSVVQAAAPAALTPPRADPVAVPAPGAEEVPLPPDPGPGPWDSGDDWGDPWDSGTAAAENPTTSMGGSRFRPAVPNAPMPLDATDL